MNLSNSRGGPALRAAFLAAGVALASCIAPPAMFAVRDADLSAELQKCPAGSEAVALDVGGATLRGVFVPAGPGAPVVLHLLGSGASVASPIHGPEAVLFQLAGLGFASLMVDYTGVGVSSGERHVDHLKRDARAIWAEALRRADGDPQRVFVRATSIGTLAFAELAVSQREFGGVVLITPVTPDNVVPRGAAFLYGNWAGPFAKLLFRPVCEARIEDALANVNASVLAIVPTDDDFTWKWERERMRQAVEARGPWIEVEGDHVYVAALAFDIFDAEVDWWLARDARRIDDGGAERLLDALPPAARTLLAAHPGARARLDLLAGFTRSRTPKNVLAAAIAFDQLPLALRTLGFEHGQFDGLDLEQTIECFSLADPTGALSTSVITPLSTLLSFMGHVRPGPGLGYTARDCETMARDYIAGTLVLSGRQQLGPRYRTTEFRVRSNQPRPKGMSAEVFEHRMLRCFLRAARIPERMRPNDDGSWRLEVFEQGAWSTLAPISPVGSGS
jgi:hypothetical protein